jgi:uncharacterized protein with beta-barrel porin domain
MTLRAYLRLGASALVLTALGIALAPATAQAECVAAGGTVTCSGTDDDGFIGGNSLTVNVQTGAFVQSVYDGNPSTFCPSFRSALRVGSGARITNAGSLLGRGNCGLGIDAQSGLVLTNTGSIQTDAEVAFAVLATNAFDVTNAGLIQTVNAGSAAFVGGNTGRFTNAGTGRVETTSADSPAVFVEDGNTLANQGALRTTGSGGFGIDAGANNTITNSGTITTTGVASPGIRVRSGGNTITNSGTITTLPIAAPRDGEDSIGIAVETGGNTITNTGTINGDYAGVALAGFGNTFINSGTLTARGTSSTAPGAALLVEGTSAITNSGTIRGTGTAAVRVRNTNLQLTNTGRIEGDVVMGTGGTGGAIILGTGGVVTGTIFGSTSGGSILGLIGSGTVSNPLVNMGSLTQLGEGNWTLGRRYEFGSVLLNTPGGTLTLTDGVTTSGGVFVQRGRLTGVGPISAFALNVSAGVLAPGAAAAGGVMTINAPVQLTATGRAEFDVSATAHDRITVNGTVTSTGNLSVIYGGTPVRHGQTFTLLTANAISNASNQACAGAIAEEAALGTGCFTLSDNAPAFIRSSAVVTNTSVTLTVQRTPFASAGVTPEEIGIGAAIDRAAVSGSDPLNIIRRLDTLTIAEARSVFGTLTTDSPVAAQTWTMLAAQTNAESLLGWLNLNAPGRDGGTWQVWGQLLARSGERAPKTDAANFDYELKGLQAGVDYAISDATRVGVTASRVDGDTFFAVGTARNDLDMTSLGVYAAHTQGPWIVNAGAAYGDGAVNATRLNGYVDPLALVIGNLAARADLDATSVFGDVSYDLPAGAWSLQPTARLSYAHIKVDALTEQVGTGLDVQAGESSSVRADAGLRAVRTTGPVRVSAAAFWSYDLKDTDRNATARLIALPGSDFTIVGRTEKRGWLQTQAGVSFDFTPSLTGTIAWTGILNDRLGGHSATAGLSYRW